MTKKNIVFSTLYKPQSLNRRMISNYQVNKSSLNTNLRKK